MRLWVQELFFPSLYIALKRAIIFAFIELN